MKIKKSLLYISLSLVIGISIFIKAELDDIYVEKLLKLSRRFKGKIEKRNCQLTPVTLKKIVKWLNSSNIGKRGKAYKTLKSILACPITKNYIERYLNTSLISSTAKYLIYNAIIESGLIAEYPFFSQKYAKTDKKSTTYSEDELQSASSYLWKVVYAEDIKRCEPSDDKNQDLSFHKRNLEVYLPTCRGVIIKLYGNSLPPTEVIKLLATCLRVFITPLFSYKKSMEYREFKKVITVLFTNSISDIAILYFSKYHDIKAYLKKGYDASSGYPGYAEYETHRKASLYIESVILYFFTHILKKGRLLTNILDIVASDNFILSTFLTLPIIKSRRTLHYSKIIIQKLNNQRLQVNLDLLTVFLCFYRKMIQMCKNFELRNWETINPLTDYDKLAQALRKCFKYTKK